MSSCFRRRTKEKEKKRSRHNLEDPHLLILFETWWGIVIWTTHLATVSEDHVQIHHPMEVLESTTLDFIKDKVIRSTLKRIVNSSSSYANNKTIIWTRYFSHLTNSEIYVTTKYVRCLGKISNFTILIISLSLISKMY